MRHLTLGCAAVSILTAISCTRSSPDAGSGSADDSSSSPSSEDDAKPLALTDARLDKYIAFRKEYNQLYGRHQKDIVEVAKAADSKTTDALKGITVVSGAMRLGEKYEKELAALRAKHGFAEAEDDRLWSAVSDVISAKASDSPMLADSLKAYREMQARGGEEKKSADEFLKGLEDEEKKGLTEARRKYGDACVDVLSRRARELGQFQMDSIREMTGQMTPGTK